MQLHYLQYQQGFNAGVNFIIPFKQPQLASEMENR